MTGQVHEDGDGLTVRIGEQLLQLPESVVAKRPALRLHLGGDVAVGIRPEHLADAAYDGSGAGRPGG